MTEVENGDLVEGAQWRAAKAAPGANLQSDDLSGPFRLHWQPISESSQMVYNMQGPTVQLDLWL